MTFKDGDGDIPTQEVGTALRALGTYPMVGTHHWLQLQIFSPGARITFYNEEHWGIRYGTVHGYFIEVVETMRSSNHLTKLQREYEKLDNFEENALEAFQVF